jgi:serine O-acetyltransferase
VGDEKGTLRHPQVGDGVIIGSGAQLLGPIEIGDYARIGSNAVVVHDVAPCTTVVGIPARPVRERAVATAVADSKPFDAYAVSAERAPDPTQTKIDTLIDELQRLRARVAQLEEQSDDIVDTAEQWEKLPGS